MTKRKHSLKAVEDVILRNLDKFARKAESWDYWWPGKQIPTASRDVQVVAASLPSFSAKEGNPLAPFNSERPHFHVAKLPDGRRFVVDTEGFDYARYIARLPKHASAKRKRRRS